MKKKVKNVIAVLALLVIIMCVYDECRASDIDTKISTDSRYKATLEMIGDPEFPFGPATARVTIKNIYSKKKIKVIITKVYTDGGRLYEGNWKVKWYEDKVEVTLMGCEQEDVLYSIDLE